MDSINSLTPDSFIERSGEILKLLSNNEVRQKIPLISNLDNFDGLKDMQLVRFRGLVQDMRDPEIYLETFQTKIVDTVLPLRKGKYRDNLKLETNEVVETDSPANVYKERRSIFMVSIPGLNDWAVTAEKEKVGDVIMVTDPGDVQSNGIKRSLANDEPNKMSDADSNQMKGVDGENTNDNKKCHSDEGANSNTESIGLSKEYLLNSPIADRPSTACLVKFYEGAEKLLLNDVLEVVGFIALDPSLCGSNRQPDEFESFNEMCAMNPPPSLIPRIHAITYRSLRHLNPLLHNGQANVSEQNKIDCYKDLRNVLTQCMFGDSVAADYLFCHLISTVYVRSDETLGQFSINLTNFPADVLPDYTKQLYEIIELCMPASHYFPITVDNLNCTEFIPTKDYETGKLTSGLLQLAPHTHLVLDETCLQPGKLESQGIESVVHISNLIRKQLLNVNFKFYTIDYNVNIPVLIFSEGKSMFPSNCHIPLKADADAVRLINETFVAVKQFLKPKLDTIRKFLTQMRLQQFDMNPQNMDMIQSDFIAMRQQFNATADDLHLLLVLSRMLGIIQSKTAFDADSWNQAKFMEEERRRRIDALLKK